MRDRGKKNTLVRIEKYLSEQGICSRREAAALIKAGLLFLNGKPVKETGIKIDPGTDEVKLHKEARKRMDQKETVLVYKPRGLICAKDHDSGDTIFKAFPHFKHLNTVGRLDKESEGLILLSNDGQITKLITDKNKDHVIEKEYEVTVREDVMPAMIRRMESGIKLDDGWTKPASAEKLSKHVFRITLLEGRKHQIRRMANALRLTVQKLERIRIGHLRKGQMRAGYFKKLSPDDIQMLKNSV